jgi:tRNA A58 N-methylase Trm61
MLVQSLPPAHDRRAGPERTLRVLVADCHEPEMALAHEALTGAGYATTGARDLAAALVLVDSADLLVLDPPDEEVLRTLAGALAPDGALVLYSERYERLGRTGRQIIMVPKGQIAALLDVVAGVCLRRRISRPPAR